MVPFDLNLQYQFGFFFGTLPDEIPADLFDPVAEILGRPVEGTSRPRILLKSKRQGEALLTQPSASFEQDASVVRSPVINWNGPGVRLSWSLLRMDLAVDASVLEELSGEKLPLPMVQRRVTSNLIAAAEHLSFPITRLVLGVQGESSSAGTDPAETVGRHFFRPSIVEDIRTGRVVELQGRCNYRDSEELPVVGNDELLTIPTNRIEGGETKWTFLPDNQVKKTLIWRYDVNTSPETMSTRTFKYGALASFYENSSRWVTERMEAIGGGGE